MVDLVALLVGVRAGREGGKHGAPHAIQASRRGRSLMLRKGGKERALYIVIVGRWST